MEANMFKIHDEESTQGQLNQNRKNALDICFHKLSYSIQTEGVQKQIIKDIDGICHNSQITAILGSSGAGKTTLLNILCKRIQSNSTNKLNGLITANGKEYDQEKFCQFANYVMQDDILMETLTVRECLLFAANLKIKSSEQEKNNVVNYVIKSMKLERCQDTLIGGQFIKGISGGERKRTSIGFELVCDPQALFLDEPTSGLDSFTAYLVIDRLRQFAHDKKRTVVLTIHQPSFDIWNMLDRIMLMVDGKFIYQGKGSQHIFNYFTKIGYMCPHQSNPADYYMSLMHQKQDETKNNNNMSQFFENYRYQIEANIIREQNISEESQNIMQIKQQLSIMTQFLYIVKRTISIQWRNPLLFKAKLGQVISMSIFLGLIYWNLPDGRDDPYNQRDQINKNGLLFFLAVGAFVEAMNPCVLSVPLERMVFLREENSKLYSIVPYFFGKLIVDVISDIIIPIIFSAIIYWMTNLRNDVECFLFFTFIMIILQFTGLGAGYLMGCLFKDPNQAFTIAQVIAIPVSVLSGFYKNRKDYPDWMRWITYLSPFKYAYEALLQNEYEVTYFIPNPAEQQSVEFNKWQSVGFLFLGFILYTTLAFCFLKKSTKSLQ